MPAETRRAQQIALYVSRTINNERNANITVFLLWVRLHFKLLVLSVPFTKSHVFLHATIKCIFNIFILRESKIMMTMAGFKGGGQRARAPAASHQQFFPPNPSYFIRVHASCLQN